MSPHLWRSSSAVCEVQYPLQQLLAIWIHEEWGSHIFLGKKKKEKLKGTFCIIREQMNKKTNKLCVFESIYLIIWKNRTALSLCLGRQWSWKCVLQWALQICDITEPAFSSLFQTTLSLRDAFAVPQKLEIKP